MRYYRLLAEWMAHAPVKTVTSARIAHALDIDSTQVRKDFAAIGLTGTNRLGFASREVCRAIEATLGFDRQYKAVLVGTGHMGGALLAYSGFDRYGLRIVAAFDDGNREPGSKIGSRTIRPLKTMGSFIARHDVHLAILAPPTEPSQSFIDRLVAAGVKAIWNFTPTHLSGPPGVLVRNEQHFSIGLSEVAYHLKLSGLINGPPNGAAVAAPSVWPPDALPLHGSPCAACHKSGHGDVPQHVPHRQVLGR